MKIKTSSLIFALFVLGLAAPTAVSAQTAGQSAAGTYQFAFTDGYAKYLEFNAQNQSDGSTVGQMYLSDEATLIYHDVDGAGDPVEKYPGFFIKADLDRLVVDKNQAVMSGIVREASIRELVGLRVLLTVEDNGDNTRVPDQLTWGVYKQIERDWKPSDSEREVDEGVGLRWLATDAERKDDVGVMMPVDETIGVNSFPVSAYAFADVASGAGDIRVQP